MKLLPFNDFDLKTPRILEALNEASRSLAELKGFANSIPNQYILINAITINEAKDSSEIENIVTTHDSIYKVLTESGYKDESAKEVVDYRSAIWRGYEIIKEKGFISTNVLVELQGMIEHNKAGVRKNPGTKLVNSKTGEVIYTPPQEEKEIRDLLKNLEDYINDKESDLRSLEQDGLLQYEVPLSGIWDDALKIIPDAEVSREIITNAVNRLKIRIIDWDESKCEKCQLCVPECPTGCITFDESNDTIVRDKDKCLRCSICYQTCPFSVIKYFIAKFSLDDGEIIYTTVKASNLNEDIVME